MKTPPPWVKPGARLAFFDYHPEILFTVKEVLRFDAFEMVEHPDGSVQYCTNQSLKELGAVHIDYDVPAWLKVGARSSFLDDPGSEETITHIAWAADAIRTAEGNVYSISGLDNLVPVSEFPDWVKPGQWFVDPHGPQCIKSVDGNTVSMTNGDVLSSSFLAGDNACQPVDIVPWTIQELHDAVKQGLMVRPIDTRAEQGSWKLMAVHGYVGDYIEVARNDGLGITPRGLASAYETIDHKPCGTIKPKGTDQ